MEQKYQSKKELFNKVLPALRTKKHELHRTGISFVKETDIWNYHVEYNWRGAVGLTIASMVNHILNTENKVYEKYVVDKLEKKRG